MKNLLHGLNSKLERAEKVVSKSENRSTEVLHNPKMEKNKQSLEYLKDNIKRPNIYVTGVTKGEEREKGKKIF